MLAPIVVGMMTNKFFPRLVKAVLPVTPVVGVLATCFLVASAVAQAREPVFLFLGRRQKSGFTAFRITCAAFLFQSSASEGSRCSCVRLVVSRAAWRGSVFIALCFWRRRRLAAKHS